MIIVARTIKKISLLFSNLLKNISTKKQQIGPSMIGKKKIWFIVSPLKFQLKVCELGWKKLEKSDKQYYFSIRLLYYNLKYLQCLESQL